MLRIAWVSPLEEDVGDTLSQSAYFSARVLPYLANNAEVEIYHNSFSAHAVVPAHHYLTLAQRHLERPYDIVLYHLDGLPANRWARVAVGLLPGIIVFHDFVFKDFGPEPVLNSAWRAHVAKFTDDEVKWPARDGEFEQDGPFAFRESAWGVACGFTSARQHDEFRRNISLSLSSFGQKDKRSFFIPVPVDPMGASAGEPTWSELLRLAFDGSPRPEHRAHKLLAAIAGLAIPLKCEWVVDEHERTAAQTLIEEFGVKEQVELISPRTVAVWENVIARAHVACHLAFTAHEQLGPLCAISLHRGKTVVAIDYGDAYYLPKRTVWKVLPGEHEAAQIREVLRTIALRRDAPELETLRHVRGVHDSSSVADELLCALRRYQNDHRVLLDRWRGIRKQAHEYLLAEAAAHAGAACDPWLLDTLFAQWKELGWCR